MATITFNDTQRDSDRMGENNDCSVKAVAISTQIGYEKAHAFLAQLGRKPRKGFVPDFDGTRWRGYLNVPVGSEGYVTGLHRIGFKAESIDCWSGKTLGTTAKHLKNGRYMVQVKGHVAAVVDGKVEDWTGDSSRRKVINVWRVVPTDTQKSDKPLRKMRHRKAKRLGLDPKTHQPI